MSGLHILFWNMYRKDLSEALASIVEEHQPAVVILAECGATVEVLLNAVNRTTVRYRFVDMIGDSKLVALTTLSSIQIHCLREEKRYSFWRVKTENSVVTLCGVHLQSALNYDREELNELIPRLRRDLESVEVFEKHNRSILIGDFNLEPFDRGFTSSEGLGAVSSLRLAKRAQARQVAHEVVVDPESAHRVVHRGEDPHRDLVRVLVGDALVHVEEVAVPLADRVFSESLDRVGKVEVDAQARRADTAPLVAHLLGRT